MGLGISVVYIMPPVSHGAIQSLADSEEKRFAACPSLAAFRRFHIIFTYNIGTVCATMTS
jgi:hypothetical protein